MAMVKADSIGAVMNGWRVFCQKTGRKGSSKVVNTDSSVKSVQEIHFSRIFSFCQDSVSRKVVGLMSFPNSFQQTDHQISACPTKIFYQSISVRSPLYWIVMINARVTIVCNTSDTTAASLWLVGEVTGRRNSKTQHALYILQLPREQFLSRKFPISLTSINKNGWTLCIQLRMKNSSFGQTQDRSYIIIVFRWKTWTIWR